MNKLLIFLLFPVLIFAQGLTDDAEIIFYWSCETDNAEVSGLIAAYTGCTITTGSVKIEKQGLYLEDANDKAVFTVTNQDIINWTSGRIGMWIYYDVYENYTSFLKCSYDGSNQIVMATNNDGTRLYFTYSTTEGGADSFLPDIAGHFQDSTWYFLEFAWDDTKDSLRGYVDGVLSGGRTDFYVFDSAKRPPDVSLIMAPVDMNYRIDQLMISSNWRKDLYALASNKPNRKYLVDPVSGDNTNWPAITENAALKSTDSIGVLIAKDSLMFRSGTTTTDTLVIPAGNMYIGIYDSTGDFGVNPIVDQINVNNKDYITISNCITVTNGIINTGTGYMLDVSVCGTGHENWLKNIKQSWNPWLPWGPHN